LEYHVNLLLIPIACFYIFYYSRMYIWSYRLNPPLASLWFVKELKRTCQSCVICLYNIACWSWTSYFQNCVSGNGNYSSLMLFYPFDFLYLFIMDWPS
jgi:hypothetical protein